MQGYLSHFLTFAGERITDRYAGGKCICNERLYSCIHIDDLFLHSENHRLKRIKTFEAFEAKHFSGWYNVHYIS